MTMRALIKLLVCCIGTTTLLEVSACAPGSQQEAAHRSGTSGLSLDVGTRTNARWTSLIWNSPENSGVVRFKSLLRPGTDVLGESTGPAGFIVPGYDGCPLSVEEVLSRGWYFPNDAQYFDVLGVLSLSADAYVAPDVSEQNCGSLFARRPGHPYTVFCSDYAYPWDLHQWKARRWWAMFFAGSEEKRAVMLVWASEYSAASSAVALSTARVFESWHQLRECMPRDEQARITVLNDDEARSVSKRLGLGTSLRGGLPEADLSQLQWEARTAEAAVP